MSSHPTSMWRRSPNKLRQGEVWLECFCVNGLFLAALILFLVNLGDLPLIDWNEGIVAQVAKEIYQDQGTSSSWIFPTLGGKPYLGQPPLVHNLIAIAYYIGGISELTTRLPGAILTAISVLLVYQVGREIFVARFPALFSALIYLTCLPVVRLGRLAMLDGPLLCFEILAILAILRSRRDLRWGLVAGISFGLLGLTKGIISLEILAISLVFLFCDTPRLISSAYLWVGISLGVAPWVAWSAAQWFHYHELKTTTEFIRLFIGQTNLTGSGSKQSVWYYLLLGLQYFLPWFMVMISGLKLARRNFHWGWGKLLVLWSGFYLAMVLLLIHYEYSPYVLPIYPALALAAGAELDLIRNLPSSVKYPRIWIIGFGLMAVLAGFTGLHWGLSNYIDFYLPFIFGSLSITFGATAVAISQQERQFIPLLFWGLYVSLFLFVISPHWIWELKTVEPVKPIAALIQKYVPTNAIVYTSMADRPTLNFYSDRQVVFQKLSQLKDHWRKNSAVYLLINRDAVKQLDLPENAMIEDANFKSLNWILAAKKTQVAD
jgi:4-amino-4-deoxy-L-arabinose transferase-like glycosyltransferase